MQYWPSIRCNVNTTFNLENQVIYYKLTNMLSAKLPMLFQWSDMWPKLCVWVQFVSCAESSKAIKSAFNHWQENTLAGILELILDLHWNNCFFFTLQMGLISCLFVCLFVYFSFRHTNYLRYLSDRVVVNMRCKGGTMQLLVSQFRSKWQIANLTKTNNRPQPTASSTCSESLMIFWCKVTQDIVLFL